MLIEVPSQFRNPAELFGPAAYLDPRRDALPGRVEIDLRLCTFVRPPALLWCTVFPLLVAEARTTCVLLVPERSDIAVYLKSVGLFDALRSGRVEVDDRGIPERRGRQVVLPLTAFRSEKEAEDLANRALSALEETGLGTPNVHVVVSELFAELASNAVQHSESPIGAFGFIQFYGLAEGERFVCGVADGGIGVRRSLERNAALRERARYDWSALDLAVRERVSGSGDATRGIGLYGVSEDMRVPGRSLIMHSGIGSLMITEEVESAARRAPLFPGTLAYLSIPT
ncbi:MAG: hypothetical protein HY775_09320 [Acidobacteria bacterium]|nr:hypothetical protein [Acidobacteriota bacterium]